MFSLIKRWWLRRKLSQITAKLLTDQKFQPELEVCKELNAFVIPAWYSDYKPTAALVRKVDPIFSSMARYTEIIKDINNKLQAEKELTAEYDVSPLEAISLDQFITRSNGYYANPQEIITSFQTCVAKLCELLTPTPTSPYNQSYNLRMLTRLFISLRVILIAVIEVGISMQ